MSIFVNNTSLIKYNNIRKSNNKKHINNKYK